MEMITRRLIGKEGGKQHSGMGNAREHKGIWNKISQKKKKKATKKQPKQPKPQMIQQ